MPRHDRTALGGRLQVLHLSARARTLRRPGERRRGGGSQPQGCQRRRGGAAPGAKAHLSLETGVKISKVLSLTYKVFKHLRREPGARLAKPHRRALLLPAWRGPVGVHVRGHAHWLRGATPRPRPLLVAERVLVEGEALHTQGLCRHRPRGWPRRDLFPLGPQGCHGGRARLAAAVVAEVYGARLLGRGELAQVLDRDDTVAVRVVHLATQRGAGALSECRAGGEPSPAAARGGQGAGLLVIRAEGLGGVHRRCRGPPPGAFTRPLARSSSRPP